MGDDLQEPQPDGERGAVIVEFAAIFVVFATLLAGLITYGMIFAVQQSLEHGASEAARSVVGMQVEAQANAEIREILDEQFEWLGGLEDGDEGARIESITWDACEGKCLRIDVAYSGSLLSLMPFRIGTPDVLRADATLQHDLIGDPGDADAEGGEE